MFQETIRDAGLNKFLFEMANIRDQNTWVHMNNPEIATAKAKDLVRMAIAKAAYIEPLHEVSLGVKKRVGNIKDIMARIGIEAERVEMFNLSSAMGGRFAEIALEMTEKIKKIGPSPIRIRLKEKVKKAC